MSEGFSRKNLGMLCVAAKFVLCMLKEDQKQTCVDVSKEHIDHANADEIFIKNILTGNETWVYGCVVKTKAQYSHWVSKTSPRPKNTRQVRSNVKVMLTVFVDCEGIIYHEFLPLGQMAKREYDEKAERSSEEKKA